MPIYEYRSKDPSTGCEKCRDTLQVLQSLKDPALQNCPSCGAALERIFSSFSVSSSILAPSNLKSHGFTTLKRRDKGVYERIS